MADSRRYGLTPQLDIGQILLDAQNRWLRPTEVCEILRNHKKFRLTPEPPFRPSGGSLFLFDRKALRYFRKDGHNWRKKKDGKTVREAHERLKAGSVDVLHCYYAHGEDNENFQRRSYWMLEEQYEHIVLVHYREVKEGNRSALRSLNTERALQSANIRGQITSPDCSTQGNSSALQSQTTYASSPSTAEWNGPTHSSECEEGESGDDVGGSPPIEVESSSGEQASHLCLNQIEGLVIDSRAQLPVSYSKAFTELLAENQANCGALDLHETSSGQYPFLELQQSDSGLCFRQDGENQQNTHFSSLNLSPYSNGEASGLSYGSGWNDFLSQNKNVEPKGNEFNPSRSISLPMWTEVRKHSTAGLMNATYDPKVNSMQAMVSEEIRRRQTGCKQETFVTDDLNGGKSVFPDGNLQRLARSDIQNIAMQINSQKSTSTSSQWNEMQEQRDEWGHESGFFQNIKCISRDLQHSHESAFQKNDQEKEHKTQNNYSSQLLTDEYASSKAENGLNPGTDFHVSKLSEIPSQVEGQEGLKKLDSFGRWMSKEIGGDGDESLVASDSGTYWNTLDNQNGVEEVSSLQRQMQLDIDLMGPSLSQEQLFSVIDFSPDWAYTEVETKILITGTFLGGLKYLQKYKWSCMFGEVEVPAELLGQSVLRCYAPPHAPGRVPFYVTCSNRLACSEVREFEYRASLSGGVNSGLKIEKGSADIILLQIRFAKSLSLNLDERDRYCTNKDCDKCSLKSRICSLTEDGEDEWVKMERSTEDSTLFLDKTREQLMQKLFKEKLYDWLLYQIHEEGKGPNVLDDQGQGAIHIAAALGYDWAISPIVAAGVNVNIRDTHGWSALHWAAFYGREETVVALVTLGAAPGAVTDPTPKSAGHTPADLASKRGHKGIAGYLAESHLTSHLSSLTFKENIMDSVSASLAGEKAVETVAECSVVPLDRGGEDQLSLKDSLAAVRNSAQAAARIQSAFRVHSFRRKQFVAYGDSKCGMSDEEALTFVSVQKTTKLGHYDEASHTAALRIQRKFRGWKGRKEFLIIRNRIVKIQAHIRGHQVRKQYKKVVWSVGIVEKAILRWRRKRVGLRGFRAEATIADSESQGQSDDYDFLRAGRKQTVAGVEKALARVQSMVRYPEARDQYRRLVTNFQKIKVGIGQITDGGDSQQKKENKTNENDELMSMTD